MAALERAAESLYAAGGSSRETESRVIESSTAESSTLSREKESRADKDEDSLTELRMQRVAGYDNHPPPLPSPTLSEERQHKA